MQNCGEKKFIFCHFILNVKAGDSKTLRHNIINDCKVSYIAYWKWAKGLSVPNAKHRKVINDVAARFGYESVYEKV